jgi:hypothetical protein
LLVGDGRGAFVRDEETRLPSVTPGEDFTLCAATGDFTGDGVADVFLGESERSPRILVNAGGRLVDQTADDGGGLPRIPATARLRAYACEAADVDGDDDLDVVVVNDARIASDFPEIQGNDVLRNDGSGHFTIDKLPLLDGPHDGRGLAVGDVDADGVLDIVIGYGTETMSHGGEAVELLLGTGDGSFVPSEGLRFEGGVFGLALGDLDEDGLLDVAIAVAEPTAGGDLSNRLLLTGAR